jgi:hypothetical protein
MNEVAHFVSQLVHFEEMRLVVLHSIAKKEGAGTKINPGSRNARKLFEFPVGHDAPLL